MDEPPSQAVGMVLVRALRLVQNRPVIVFGDLEYVKRWYQYYLTNRGVVIDTTDECETEEDSEPGESVG